MRRTIKLCAVDDCTGCWACVNSCSHDAIQMIADKEGFMHPSINKDKCTCCGLCELSCPILHNNNLFDNSTQPSTYVAWAKDEAIRSQSSSGGIFSILAEQILDDGGIVYGASMASNHRVCHIGITEIKDLSLLRGSKYVQSDMNQTMKDAKKHIIAGRKVLFTGTPCQIAGMRQLLRKDFDNLLLVDIFCHGVPPQKFLKDTTIKLSQTRYDTSAPISFRKTEGWECQLSYGGKAIRPKDNIYLSAFMKSLDFREGCYHCPFARLPRQGDISIGDFWGIGKKLPFDQDTSKGTSCVLINNAKGAMIWDAVKDKVFKEKRQLSEAQNENPNIYRPSVRPIQRNHFYHDFYNLSTKEFMKKYQLYKKRSLIARGLGFILRKINLR